MLPGRDTLQALATVPGLVRSAAPTRPEVAVVAGSPAAEPSGTRRRRGGRGRGGESPEIFGTEVAEALPAPTGGTAAADTAVPEAGSGRRPEPEVVLVPMQPDQELVYGWMGLNPTLLLDTQPSGDEPVVRVVRPDADPDAVLSEARQQLSNGGSRRRSRGRGGGDNGKMHTACQSRGRRGDRGKRGVCAGRRAMRARKGGTECAGAGQRGRSACLH